MKYMQQSETIPGAFTNPGAGAVIGECGPEGAAYNVSVFVADLVECGAVVTDVEPIIGAGSEIEEGLQMGGTRYSETHDGRWPFRLTVDGRKHLLEMPGLHIDEVRFMDRTDQNIWDFPRVFIDGSSWIWSIGLRVLSDKDDESYGDYGTYLGDE